MDKNSFLIYNNLVHHLYTCENFEQLMNDFLKPLKMLIPYSYASILFANPNINKNSIADVEHLYKPEPLCTPDIFVNAERKYIERAKDDPFLWLMHGSESTLICESDMLEEEVRLNSALYQYCYKSYNIYDSLQYSIVCRQTLLGVLTLFRTRTDGAFDRDDMFYLRSIGSHVNDVFYRLVLKEQKEKEEEKEQTVEQLGRQYHLTNREQQVLRFVFAFYNNDEIAEEIDISEYTVQKHIQNILRKMNVTSRLGLLREYR